MPRLTDLATNFASGELDPTLRGQKNLDAYRNGAKRCRNVQRRSTGGMERRAGTYDLAGLIGLSRLEAFEFAADQRYLIGFSNGRVEARDVDGNLLQAITGAPWTATSMWEMSTSQLGDDMIITHTSFWPRLLRRTGPTSFTLTLFKFDVAPDGKRVFQPYYKFEAPDVTVKPGGFTGSVSLVSNPGIFQDGHVGLRFRIYDSEVLITAVASATNATATVQGPMLEGKLDLDPLKTKKDTNLVEVLHLYHGLTSGNGISLDGANTCGGIPGNFFDGTFPITVVDEHHYQITLTGVAYDYWEDKNQDGTPAAEHYTAARLSEDGGGPNVRFNVSGAPTRMWAEPAFSAVRGYPGAVCFHEGRLWFGGSTSQPDGCWGSNALQFFRFDSGKGYDADSVQVATGTEDISITRHLISNGELMVMNANGESAFIVRDGEPITPNNARIKGLTTAGCSTVQPCVFDGAVIFTQDNGLSAYEMVWSGSEQKFETTPISTLAQHLIRTPKAIAASHGTTSRSEQLAFFVNADGTIAIFHSLRSENVAGWVLWELGGGALARSVATLGPYVYVCVEVRGTFRLYRLADTDLVSLDGAVAHASMTGPTKSWVLDARVRSRTVDLVSELGYHGTYAVPASGAVELDTAVASLVAGDGFAPIIETLPPSIAVSTGPRDGMIKRIVRSIVDFGDDTLAATVEGCPIPTRLASDMGGAVRAVTSPYEMGHLGCERDPTLTLSQSAPLAPWRVLSVLQEVQI